MAEETTAHPHDTLTMVSSALWAVVYLIGSTDQDEYPPRELAALLHVALDRLDVAIGEIEHFVPRL